MGLQPSDLKELDGEFPSLSEPPAIERTLWRKGGRALQIAMNFVLGQGAVQGIGAIAGFLLVRHMSVESYAQFGMVTAFQSVVAVLMDLGFAGTIIPLVGPRRDDRSLVGRYVMAAKHLRDRSFLIIAPVATVAFLAMMHRQHWAWHVQLLLVLAVLLSLYSGGKMSYFSAPLFLYGKLRDYYVPQIWSGLGRLFAFLVMLFAGGLSAWTAAGLTALNVTWNAEVLERKSSKLMEWPDKSEPAKEREIVRYILPAAPMLIVAAFQSQISLLLISIFGGTVQIADVAALGRIGQLFTMLMTFNAIVIEPYMARQGRERLLRKYLVLLLLGIVALVPVVALGFLRPGIFLWLLGPRYAGLGRDVGWLILASCMGYTAGLMWIMNRSRMWLYWSGTAIEIGLLLGLQVGYVVLVGVRTVHAAVMLMVVSSFSPLIAHAYVALVGFRKGARRTSASPA
jgi:O-antigen/teichoic acid export membrane protein